MNNRTKANRPTGCRMCRGNRITKGQIPAERTLAGQYSEIARDLNAEQSGFTATQVLYGSKQVAW